MVLSGQAPWLGDYTPLEAVRTKSSALRVQRLHPRQTEAAAPRLKSSVDTCVATASPSLPPVSLCARKKSFVIPCVGH